MHPVTLALLSELAQLGSETNRAGMARFGINVDHAFGISVTVLRKIAKRVGTDHELALSLWATGKHEARLLACFVDDPAQVSEAQMESWVADLDSWDVCDQATTSLFDRTKHGWSKAKQWAVRESEFEKRAGFSLMAGLASHDKLASDEKFRTLFPLIESGAFDERNFVKKAVNWALRGIGKRNAKLQAQAIACAYRIASTANEKAGAARGGSPAIRAARWVSADALRELRSEQTTARVQARSLAVGRRR